MSDCSRPRTICSGSASNVTPITVETTAESSALLRGCLFVSALALLQGILPAHPNSQREHPILLHPLLNRQSLSTTFLIRVQYCSN